MRRKLGTLISSMLLLGVSAVAQNTIVSATVVDSDSTTWANGTWQLSFVPNPSQPNPAIYNINGVPLSPSVMNQIGTMNSSGVLSITMYQTAPITPVGSQWQLTVCPNATSACGIYTFTAIGLTQNLSSALTTIIPPPRFHAVAGSYGYVDAEAIILSVPGSTYWSTSQNCQRYYDGSVWACGAGTVIPLPVSIANGGTGAVTAATALAALQGVSLVNTSPQTMAGPLNVPVLNSYYYANDFPGADWVAKVNAAIAALPALGGTVFVPASLAGSASGNIVVSGGVCLSFGFGTFYTTGTVTKSGSGGRIEGISPTSTIVQFIGGTNGFVLLQEAITQKDFALENFTIRTSSAAALKGFSFSSDVSPNNNPATNVMVRNIDIDTTGSGHWNYGIFLQNFISASGGFLNVGITGAIDVGVHGDCATGETSFINVGLSNHGIRGYEFVPGNSPNNPPSNPTPSCGPGGDDVQIIAGGIQGSYSGSGLYAQGYTVYLSGGLHFDSVGAFGDGAQTVIADNTTLDTDEVELGDLLATYTSAGTTIHLRGGTAGNITLVSETQGSMFGVNYKSLTLNGASISMHGNRTNTGGADNLLTIGNLLTITANYAAGTVTMQNQGTTFFTDTNGSTHQWTAPANTCLAWGPPGSEDSWLCRLGSNSYGFGSAYGAHNGSVEVGGLQTGVGTSTLYRCIGGTDDGLMVWKTSVCTGAGGSTTSTAITTP